MHCARQSNRAVLSAIAMLLARRLTKKGLINHAARHRGRTACELMDWLSCEVRGPTRGTTALASQYPQGGESRKPTRFNLYWGRGGFRVRLIRVRFVMSIAIRAPKAFTKQEVIELIQKMRSFNQVEQARETFSRENALHPEWNLKAAFEALKQEKQIG